MRLANRMSKLPPYLFRAISQTIARKRAEGHDVISLGIGDPDLPTPDHVVDRLCQAARNPVHHRYPESDGLPEFRQCVADWYARRFGVQVDPSKEVTSLIGSKEGIGHMAIATTDPGDVALVPDPAYPVYAIGTMFAGGEVYPMPLTAERGFLPDLDAIPDDVARRAKVIWINYPNNPTGATAEADFFERVVAFARRYDLLVCSDFAYSDVAYDGYQPTSFLQVPGAKEVAVEFHSLSKSYNMTGWRIGMAVGNATAVDGLVRVKSNLDSGAPQAIQEMAIAALEGPQEVVEVHNRIYQRRRDAVIATLRRMGLQVTPPKASLYVWAPVPAGYTSIGFASRLLEDTDVVVTPGVGYGAAGEGYIRISLTTPDDRLDEALRRLASWQPPAPETAPASRSDA